MEMKANLFKNYYVSVSGYVYNANSGRLLKTSIDGQQNAIVHLYTDSGKKKKLRVKDLVADLHMEKRLKPKAGYKIEIININFIGMDCRLTNLREVYTV